jgi:hypothetical protein
MSRAVVNQSTGDVWSSGVRSAGRTAESQQAHAHHQRTLHKAHPCSAGLQTDLRRPVTWGARVRAVVAVVVVAVVVAVVVWWNSEITEAGQCLRTARNSVAVLMQCTAHSPVTQPQITVALYITQYCTVL